MRDPIKKAAAIGVGIIFSLLLLASLEVTLRLNQSFGWVDVRSITSREEKHGSDTVEIWDGVDKRFLGGIPDHFQEIRKKYGSRANTEWTRAAYLPGSKGDGSYRYLKLAPEGDTVFDIQYRYNEKQRRPTPGQPSSPTSSIFLVGDSFVLGEGVREDETIAAFMQNGLRHTAVESLAFHGWGINNHLSSLRGEYTRVGHPNPYRKLENRPIIVVYVYITDHIYRATCPLSCYRKENEWMLGLPNYAIRGGGKAKYLGTFSDSRWFSPLLRWIAESATVTQLGLDWPPSGSIGGPEKVFGILNAYRKELGNRVPIKDFYFVPLPVEASMARGGRVSGEKINWMAKKNGYNVIDLSKLALPKMTKKSTNIPFDGHFAAPANYILSRLIISKIQKEHSDIR